MDKQLRALSELSVWSRQDTDTTKSYEAFCLYRDLGVSRSLNKSFTLYKSGKKALRKGDEILTAHGTFQQWSIDHNWQERVGAWDGYQDSLRQERNTERQKLIEDNAYGDYEMLRDAIEKYKDDYTSTSFNGVKPADISNLINLMKHADDYARRAVGLPDKITESKTELKVDGAIIIQTGMSLDDL